MKTFFSEEERARLREKYISRAIHTLDVFKIAQEEKDRLLGLNSKHCEYGIDMLDVALGNLGKPEMAEIDNREKLIQLLEKWLAIPQVDFELAAMYLEGELGIGESSNQTMEQRLNNAYEKIQMSEELMELANRFPYLLMEDQFSGILTADKQELNSMKPQSTFLHGLTLDDIASGNVDYPQLREVNKFHSPFSPTLLTLQDIQGMELPKEHCYFPMVNLNFYGRRRYDFKGLVEVIPKDVFEALTSLDSRIYQFGREGIQLRNVLTAVIMSGKQNQKAVLGLCEKIKRADYQDIRFTIDKNILLNIGMLTQDEELLTNDTRKQAESLMDPKKSYPKSIKEKSSKLISSNKRFRLRRGSSRTFKYRIPSCF